MSCDIEIQTVIPSIQALINSVNQVTTQQKLDELLSSYELLHQAIASSNQKDDAALLQELAKLLAAFEAKKAAIAAAVRYLFTNKKVYRERLSEYKLERDAAFYLSPFGFSKEEKLLAANKVIAYLFGADQVELTERDIKALDNGQLKTKAKAVFEQAPESGGLDFVDTLKKIPQKIQYSSLPGSSDLAPYQRALIQVLEDYKHMREKHGDYHGLFRRGFNKQEKTGAAQRLIKFLGSESYYNVRSGDILALSEGTLKNTIVTMLSYFSDAPTFDRLMLDFAAPKTGLYQDNIAKLGQDIVRHEADDQIDRNIGVRSGV